MASHETSPRITEYGWQLVERMDDETGELYYFLNKRRKGKTAGCIMLNKKELQHLKHFMEDRKIE